MNELIKERNELAKAMLLQGRDHTTCVPVANSLMAQMYGDDWQKPAAEPQGGVTNPDAEISIVENADGEKWVRVQALGEDFVVAPKDLDGGNDNFTYDSAKERLAELKLDTFNRKQGFIIAIYIEAINAKLAEVGGDEFATDWYVSSELRKPVGSTADYHGNSTWSFYGGGGVLNNFSRYNDYFRSRPVLAYSSFLH